MTNILGAFSRYFAFIVIGATAGLALDAGLQRLLNNWLHRHRPPRAQRYLVAMKTDRGDNENMPWRQKLIWHPLIEQLTWVIPAALFWHQHSARFSIVSWIGLTWLWTRVHTHDTAGHFRLPCIVKKQFENSVERRLRITSLFLASTSYTIAWGVAYYGANGAKWSLVHYFSTSLAPIIAHSAHNYLVFTSSKYRELRGFF